MFTLTSSPSVACQFIAELRDVRIQQDSMRFRKNMERLGELLAYEVSKAMRYEKSSVTTPLGNSETWALSEQPVLATVLRAGLPLFQGFMNFFDRAESAFIGAYRSTPDAQYSFDIELNYIAAPNLNNKNLILIDPMLATGKSIVKAKQALLKYGLPKQIHIVAAIASRQGVEYVSAHLPDCHLWVGAVDEEMNHKSYIVPGLGDAGDLAFGEKL
ncbi:uracil phosphoribosyltransferase [Rhodocytophaga rosea]|uniref:Uracil phosphoribosyltransferase n=1 Tax=Rhodocytophaga rosea TaxID=2704465 RepID=A0A6C0GJ04_9BACT|nr:uracil phosphoribosyltransferase [Rhodocytophaga rosea]QHT68016.1 uracil phosphoribosyltransferase [Rhodocytophaga rosea]